MDDPRLDLDAPDSAAWLRASTLDERVALDAPALEQWAERGAERFGRWRSEQGLTGEHVARRRATSGLTEVEWFAQLGEPDDALRARFDASGSTPPWLARLLRDLSGGSDSHLARAHPWIEAPANARFLDLVEPILASGVARLVERTNESPAMASLDVAELMLPIRTRLLDLIERTLILEMHIAGLTGALMQQDPDERFDAFVSGLSDPDTRVTILQTYPVLARAAWTYVDQWVRHTAALIEAIDVDANDLAAMFGPVGDPVSVRAVASDPHRDGRHVWFVDFANGTRLVHKPRPCGAEAAFQEYVRELDDAGLEPQLRVIKVLARADHGWLEYVEAAPLTNRAAAADFHRRQGAWLPVLWSLACNDMHYENIRASGAHAVPIDHETVLRNRLTSAPDDDLDDLMDDIRGESVAAIGLLPSPIWDDGFGGYIDQSGMGVGYDDAGSVTAPRVVGSGADMRIEAAVINPERQHNRAELDGSLLDPRDHVEDVEAGFASAWQFLAARPEEVQGLLARFDDAVVRMVLRPTQNYVHLLNILGHPEYQQDAIERERALLQLWMYPESQAWRVRVVESERRQLLIGDVPWFGAVASSTDIQTGDGALIENAIGIRGFDVARERAASMSAERFERELWFVRSALSRRGVGSSVALPVRGTRPDAIADELVRDIRERSLRFGSMRSWFVLTSVGAGTGSNLRFAAAPAAHDLYSGLPGIAFVLGAHTHITGSQPSLEAARAAIQAMRARQHPLPGIGAYDGAAGLVWTFMQLAEWLDDAFLLDDAERAARFIEGALDDDRQLDIISGAAGCIPVLLELERVRPGALDLAMRCGNHLLEHATSLDALPFARGLSHGASGVAWALTRLSRVTGEPRWEAHAHRLLAAEDAALRTGQWADNAEHPDFAAWCHGAPGIALARADIVRMTGRNDADDVLDRVASAARDAPAQDTHGICHGELGNIDALFDTADLLDRADLRDEAERRLQRTLVEIGRLGARSTGPRHIPTPGMMLGTGGIAYALLRSQARERLPSILLPGSVVRAGNGHHSA
jgi:type 2 lantibiotic biosynthesis protein LanM